MACRWPRRSGAAVAAGVAAVAGRRQIAALDVAATWRPADANRQQADAAVPAVLAAASLPGQCSGRDRGRWSLLAGPRLSQADGMSGADRPS